MKIGHAIKLSQYPDHTPEWHQARRAGIGGSEAAVVLGHNPYGKSRYELWEQKTGVYESTFSGNFATRYGSKIESYLLDRLLWDFGYSATECDYQLQHPDHQFMICNLDGVIMDDADVIGIIEIKSSSMHLAGDQPHEYHMPQIQHNLAVTGLPFCIYVYHVTPIDRQHALAISEQFVGGDHHNAYWHYLAQSGDIKVIRVERDDSYIEHLIRHEKEFWHCVQTETVPPKLVPDGEIEIEDAALSELLKLYARALQEVVQYKPPKELEDSKSSIMTAIKQRCDVIAGNAGAKKIHTPDGSITWNARGYWQARPGPVSSTPDNKNEAPF
jgi:putative phage-type endonuclease